MAIFKDQNGKEWSVTLDGPKVKAVREACGIDLAGLTEQTFDQLYEDIVLLVDVLWVLCRSQATTAGITDEQFGAALVGDAIDRAVEAMLAAILDFSPSRKREVLRTLAAKTNSIRNRAMDRAMERLNDPALEDKLLAAMDRQTVAALQKALTQLGSATDSPAS